MRAKGNSRNKGTTENENDGELGGTGNENDGTGHRLKTDKRYMGWQ